MKNATEPGPRDSSSGSDSGDSFAEANGRFVSQRGETIASLSEQRPVLVVFLRHSGCTFCREALDDLSKQRDEIESQGTEIVLVHMGDNDSSQSFFESFGLGDVHRIGDPSQELYRAYGLGRGGLRQLIGGDVITRGFRSVILERRGVGIPVGDVTQMPGVFLVDHNRVLAEFRHTNSASRPDYCELAQTPTQTS